MKRESAFTDGLVEGVVIRVDEGEWLKERAKLVRTDFIAGNEHWSKGIVTRNGVDWRWKEEKEREMYERDAEELSS